MQKYLNIINPNTNKNVKITTTLGINIIKNYVNNLNCCFENKGRVSQKIVLSINKNEKNYPYFAVSVLVKDKKNNFYLNQNRFGRIAKKKYRLYAKKSREYKMLGKFIGWGCLEILSETKDPEDKNIPQNTAIRGLSEELGLKLNKDYTIKYFDTINNVPMYLCILNTPLKKINQNIRKRHLNPKLKKTEKEVLKLVKIKLPIQHLVNINIYQVKGFDGFHNDYYQIFPQIGNPYTISFFKKFKQKNNCIIKIIGNHKPKVNIITDKPFWAYAYHPIKAPCPSNCICIFDKDKIDEKPDKFGEYSGICILKSEISNNKKSIKKPLLNNNMKKKTKKTKI